MKKNLLYLAFILVSNMTFAQSTFQMILGDSLKLDGEAMTRTNSGGICLAAIRNDDIALLNFDSLGTLLWSHQLGSSDYDQIADLVQLPDGGFALTGLTTQSGFNGISDIFVMRIDSQGSPLYFKTFGESLANDIAHKILYNPSNDGLFIFGATYSYGVSSPNPFVLSVDSLGNQLWSSVIDLGGYGEYQSALITTGGELIAVGYGDNMGTQYDLITKFDVTGNIIWTKKINGPEIIYLTDVVQATNGDIVCLGQTIELLPDSTYGYNVIRLDSTGTIIWNYNFTHAVGDQASGISSLPNGDFLLTGVLAQNDTSFASIIKINFQGNLIWAKGYANQNRFGSGKQILNQGNAIYMFGTIIHSVISPYESLFVKTDLSGNSYCNEFQLSFTTRVRTPIIDTGATSIHPIFRTASLPTHTQSFNGILNIQCSTVAIEDPLSSNIKIFPNPSSGIFKIEVGSTDQHTLEIYNLLGKKILTQKFSQDFLEIDLSTQSPGIYFCKIDGTKSLKILIQ